MAVEIVSFANDLRSHYGNPNMPNFSKHVDNLVLAPDVPETYTPPAGAKRLIMTGTDNFWVNASGGVAAVPVADVLDGSGSALCPMGRRIDLASVPSLSVVSAVVCSISIEVWQ